MTATDRRERIKEMFVDALNRFKLGMDVEYDFTFGWGPLPTVSGMPPQFVLAYWMFAHTPHPLLGQEPIGTLIVCPDLFASQKVIDDLVLKHMGNLREAKAKVLAGANGMEHKDD